MTNWAAIGIVTAAELTVFFAATVRCFTAKSRLDRERDGDIRAAIAGYEAGQVIPVLTDLVARVIDVNRPDERIVKALTEGTEEGTEEEFNAAITEGLDRGDTDKTFNTAVDAAIKSRSPRAKERGLIHRYTGLGLCLVACHVSGPAALYNLLTGGYNLPRTAVIVAAVIFAVGVIGAALVAILVQRGESALSSVIREGKDAA